jgi:hypothetical protein
VTYRYGSGSADPYLWLTVQDSDPTPDSDPTLDSDPDLTPDPTPHPGIFVSDLQDKKS